MDCLGILACDVPAARRLDGFLVHRSSGGRWVPSGSTNDMIGLLAFGLGI